MEHNDFDIIEETQSLWQKAQEKFTREALIKGAIVGGLVLVTPKTIGAVIAVCGTVWAYRKGAGKA